MSRRHRQWCLQAAVKNRKRHKKGAVVVVRSDGLVKNWLGAAMVRGSSGRKMGDSVIRNLDSVIQNFMIWPF